MAAAEAHARLGPELTLIGCGGAKLPAELTYNLEGLGFRVLTGYGLTETTAATHVNRPTRFRFGSVGLPVPGVEARIAAIRAA